MKGSTSQDPQSRSVHSSGQVASQLCETCGNAWATLRQESLIHLEDFYFFMDCTGHEIIISSGPHPAPRIQEIALFSTQDNPWTQALAQILWPFERLDFPRPPKSLSTLKWPSCKRAVRSSHVAMHGRHCDRRICVWCLCVCVQIQNDTNPCEDLQDTCSSKFTVRLLHIFPSEDACFGFRHLFVT